MYNRSEKTKRSAETTDTPSVSDINFGQDYVLEIHLADFRLYEVIRMSGRTNIPTHERLARIKDRYWERDWDIDRLLAAANRIYDESPQ